MINRNLIKMINALLGFIITMLGFSSCEGETADMYGSPYCKFELKGKVTTESGAVVENSTITVKPGYKVENDGYVYMQSNQGVKTNGNGEYLLSTTSPINMEKVRIICTPPDTNILKTDSIDIDVVYIEDNTKDEGWCIGSFSRTINFKLKSKESK